MFFLDLQSRVPIYEQIKQNILRLIALNILQPNELLPSVRSVAKELGINPNTVQKAYRELESQGVLYSVAGKGNFVCDTASIQNDQRLKQLELLTEAFANAKTYGVSKEEIYQRLESVYKEETSC